MRSERCGILYIMASPTWGGGEEYIYRIVEALRGDAVYDCHTIAMSRANAARMSAVADVDHVFDFRPGSLFDLVSAVRIARIADRRRIGIIHVNKFSHAFLAVWARALSRSKPRVVMTRHLIRKGKTGRLYAFLYNRLDRLIFVSELARSEFLSRGARIDEKRVSVIHNGIPDLPQNPPQQGEGAAVTIAFAGRLIEDKGLGVLLEALSRLGKYDFRMKLIGNGPAEYRETLERAAEQDGLAGKVVFSGFTTDVNAALQEAEIGILPSIGTEGFPMAVLEYMRAGLAVVASRNGGQVECLTEGENAFLVPPGDPGKLAEAVERLLADPETRGAMGANARKVFLAGFTYDKFLERMTEIYREVCE